MVKQLIKEIKKRLVDYWTLNITSADFVIIMVVKLIFFSAGFLTCHLFF
jgi:hypothetical protein